MRVGIDDARHGDEPGCVNFPFARLGDPPNLNHSALMDPDVRLPTRETRAVDHRRATNDTFEHYCDPLPRL